MRATAVANATILIVEDDPTAREDLSTLLRSEGYRIAAAGDGLAAINLLRAGLRPDLILLDMILPGADGWQFFAERQRDPAVAAIPVVIMTGVGIASDDWAHALGAVGLLRKPIGLDDLLATIRRRVQGLTGVAPPKAGQGW
jgi:CheY-like chemotaxis protein